MEFKLQRLESTPTVKSWIKILEIAFAERALLEVRAFRWFVSYGITITGLVSKEAS